jgi:phosphoribosyl-ATP pyrophosphohydrolase
MTLDKLYQIICGRKRNAPAGSYVASLFEQGNDRIIQKVGEEAIEVVIAAKNDSNQQTISEMADLLFHLLVLMAAIGVTPSEAMQELNKRQP